MTSDRDLSQVTLEHFRREAAGPHPMPAGVAIAAVSAGFALGLIAKVLAVSGRRNIPPDDAARLEPLAAASQTASQRMLQLAGDDIAAFEAYLAARRLPRETESECAVRQQGIDSAVRRAIDLPLAAAAEAVAGLQLCSEVSAFTPVALAADLGVTAGLLAGALRGFLLCAQSNVLQLAPDAASYRERLATEAKRHEQALHQAEVLLERARTAVQTGTAAETGAIPTSREP
ncbi:MAG TPA: cyclodeaminase/cyclohydrolase family protein [Steroidobacteraceae bacterium]|nr:cyclodeaminase/cyclohydrolase family protein [Steroidobacteraceae bacterium]